MKIRSHRGGFAESLATLETINYGKSYVAEYFEKYYGFDINEDLLDFQPVAFDSREGWKDKTFLVTFDGIPLGYTNEMVY